MKDYNVIVVGFGAMGSASLYQLAKTGVSVLGIDQFDPPHTNGSSHGDTRITRLAIGEGEAYVPMVKRSHEIWRELENRTNEKLLHTTGGLIISSKSKSAINHVEGFFDRTLEMAKKHDIEHQIFNADQIRNKFPQFNVANDEVGYFESDAGYLIPEKCIQVQLDQAKSQGAIIRVNEKMLSYNQIGDQVVVKTDRGSYRANKLVLTIGSWMPTLVPDLSAITKVYRQILYWFDISHSNLLFDQSDFPIFVWELQGDKQGIYGFPAVNGKNGGIKIATEQTLETTDPNQVNRSVTPAEIDFMYQQYVKPYLNQVGPKCLRAETCLYTVTPDFHFVIDWHPNTDKVLLVSPCSGHGFKHSATIGEIVTDLVIRGKSKFDLTPFGLSRFSS